MTSRFLRFLATDVWRVRLNDLPRGRSLGIRLLRILLLAVRRFGEDDLYLRASALTLYSLLGIVPVLAMAFGIAKGFGFEKYLRQEIMGRFQGQEEVAGRIIDFAHTLLEATQGGLVAGVGVIVLFWAVVRVLRDIENSFNAIWGIETGRGLGRKISDYLTILVVCPLLLTLSGSLTLFLHSRLEAITSRFTVLAYVSAPMFMLVRLLPLCMIWGLFAFLYIMMPNTRVRAGSGLMAGLIAGSLFQLVQWGYIHFQVGVSRYNAIYGSFAALPLFMVWLQVSWMIVLLGAEVAFAHQNVDTYGFEPDSREISLSFKKLLSLMAVHLVTRRFARGERPFTAQEISLALQIPVHLLRQLLSDLVKSGIVSEVKLPDQRDPAFQPAFAIHDLTISRVLTALDERGVDSLPVAETAASVSLKAAMEDLNKAIRDSPANRLLKDI